MNLPVQPGTECACVYLPIIVSILATLSEVMAGEEDVSEVLRYISFV